MSVSTVIAITASTQANIAAMGANIAAMGAHETHVVVCKDVISSFNSTNASVDAMQSYAECVNLLYPTNTVTTGDIVFLKILFVFLL